MLWYEIVVVSLIFLFLFWALVKTIAGLKKDIRDYLEGRSDD